MKLSFILIKINKEKRNIIGQVFFRQMKLMKTNYSFAICIAIQKLVFQFHFERDENFFQQHPKFI